jgi:peptidoglycan-associated lipoprotein
MKQHPQTYIFVEGHCDERGPAAYNLSLGSRRSNSVRNELVKQGVDLNHVFTISYGKERPVAVGNGEEFWLQNRRAQFNTFEKQ